MIDFNDKDLEDLSDEQKQILDELVTDIDRLSSQVQHNQRKKF